MIDPASFAKDLSALPHLVPRDYFHGIRPRSLCLADNIVVFLRRNKQALQQRTFESRPHHRHVLLVTFQTAGSINVDGAAYPLQPGTAFLIRPYQFHFYIDLQGDELCWLFITFETENDQPFDSFANLPLQLGPEHLRRCLEIAQAYSRRDSADAALDLLTLSASTLLTQLRHLALERSAPLVKQPPRSSSGYALVERVNHLLESHSEARADIQRLSQGLAISESHLRKRFKALTGISLGSYLVHYKLNRAVKLLAHSNASLTQISLDCGYESLPAFSRSFKAKLGVTPSQYRKNATFAGR
ncbi:AraC family transcriptional regulator [Pelagicoccus sp. SDUM812003]|uniref:helix-turn-helix transcriptional regulator n=1 Tax=Pelagicoccus sp. SDUM812003 TaxID=3041267 RepID=UPI00280CB50F|nr:AraC family transcriptional regulator [Pelagicoccus sp. SDUM812003]MDQ8205220.1 AraC family transcriptional regulator [Pelagicoccus sp. SDUM812003]